MWSDNLLDHLFSSGSASHPRGLQLVSAEHRCALEILSYAGTVGHPLAELLDRGVNRKLIAEIIRKGLAVPMTIKIGVGRNKTRISHVRITDAGRRALVEGDTTEPEGEGATQE
jgi:hypothetical protein